MMMNRETGRQAHCMPTGFGLRKKRLPMNNNPMKYGLKVLPALVLLLGIFQARASFPTAPDTTRVDVAYGKQNRIETSSAFSTVSGEDLRKSQVSTLSNAFFGRIPGLTAMTKTGEIGYDEASVWLRGQHTSGDNGFMILVNGFEVSGFNQITAEEIESITYLKDAPALALYGMNGGNGVLLITTKRGRPGNGKLNISVTGRYGVQLPQYKPRFKGSYEYATLYNEALANDGQPALYTERQLEGYRTGSNPYLYPDVNWYDEILKSSGHIQDYTLSFRGADRFVNYYVMAGFMENKGLYKGTDGETNSNIGFQRINFRANADIYITKMLTAQVDLGGRIEDRKFPQVGTGTMWKNMATYAPNLYPVRTPEGYFTGSAKFPNNPVGDLLGLGWSSRHAYDVQATARLTHKLDFITRGLSVYASIALNSSYQNGYAKTRQYAYYEPIYTKNASGADEVYFEKRSNDTDLSVWTGSDSETSRMYLQAGFEYDRHFGEDHHLSGLLMYQQNTRSVLGQQAIYAQQLIAGRINYAYRQKYLLEAVVSYNGSENYAKGNRFGVFPAGSVGWVISNEDFLKENRTLNFLKLRASAGLVGNNRGASRFAYEQYWGIGANKGYYYGTAVKYYDAFVQLALSNKDLTWEKSTIYNAGLETRWFGNRLAFDIDVFLENRSDILVDNRNSIPSFSGIGFSTPVNKGKVRNYGTEFSLMYYGEAAGFRYYAGGTFSFARNKITASYETPRAEPYMYRQGHPVGQPFGLEAIGFFRDESDIENSPRQAFTPVRPGDLKYRDQNGDNVIDANDEVAIGRPTVPEINYGIQLGVEYKGFDLQLLFDGLTNYSLYLSDYNFWPFVNNANISDWAAAGRWTPENSANATFPRLTTQANTNNYRSSDFWVRNTSLFRLRNLELGYTFTPGKGKVIGDMRFYLSGLNLFTVHNLDVDVSPETRSYGYPTYRTFTVGLNVTFNGYRKK